MKYIILDDNYQSAYILMKDIEHIDNVRIIYKDKLNKSSFKNVLYRLFLSQQTKKYCPFWLRKFWYAKLFKEIHRDENLCFVMITAWYDRDFIKWIRKKYDNASVVLIFRDTVQSNLKRNLGLEPLKLNTEFDLVLSYDPVDVKKYNFKFAPVYMSKMDEKDIQVLPRTDLCFIGSVKDRLKQIHKIGQLVTDNNGKIDFYLLGASEELKANIPGIIYGKETMDRMQCLSRELSSNCILEILKGDAHANTLRFWEAIIYNKKFVTNWKGVKESPYYNDKFIRYFDKIEDIDIDFITKEESIEYNYNNEFSPINLLKLLEESLYT